MMTVSKQLKVRYKAMDEVDYNAACAFARHHRRFNPGGTFCLDDLGPEVLVTIGGRVVLVFSGVFDYDSHGVATVAMTAAAWAAVVGGYLDVPFQIRLMHTGWDDPTVMNL